MSRAEYLRWIIGWFSQRGPIPAAFDVETANYIEVGLIDSLTVIDLVEDIESAFNIAFDEAAFQDRRFVNIGGLADIVTERAARNN